MSRNINRLIKSIFICELAGIIGSIFTAPAVSGWYEGLKKPSFTPPNWVFAPAWTALFALMGISLYLVWNKAIALQISNPSEKEKLAKSNAQKGLNIFLVQLVLNMGWSFLFFGLHHPLLAFLEIIILWLIIAATIFSFYKVDKRAAYLLLPYILWISFAAVLNFAVWRFN